MRRSRALLEGLAAPRMIVITALCMKKDSEKMPNTTEASCGLASSLGASDAGWRP